MINGHNLRRLLEPQSLAIIGASGKAGTVGQVILSNILASGYKGKVWPVNPKYREVLGRSCVASVEEIGAAVDLAIATTAPRTIPGLVEQCGKAGIRYLIVANNLTSLAHASLEKRMLDAARQYGVRILGPKSLGIIRPRLGLNATFARTTPLAGDLAVVTQSGAMGAAILDWATTNRIGISSMAVLGNACDIDFGEILDYLTYDDKTRFILLHVERIRDARRFMSALRSAARSKPVILFKSGELSASYADEAGEASAELMKRKVFDTAVRRAGVVQVRGISQLFHAAKALATGFRPRSNRLVIISNGTGPAAMAGDAARAASVPLARLDKATIAALRDCLSKEWDGTNPIDLGGDASVERYLYAIAALRQDSNVGAILVVLSPLATVQPEQVAEGIAAVANQHRVPLCCCFMGGDLIAAARQILEAAGVPAFRNPETVVDLFRDLSNYFENQKMLLEVPGATPDASVTGSDNAKVLVEALLAENRTILSAFETRALLHSCGIAASPWVVARSPSEAMFLAEQIGLPVHMRLDFHDFEASDFTALERRNLASLESVRRGYQELVETARQSAPEEKLIGVVMEKHHEHKHARQLRIGVHRDPTFGSVISFGGGGERTEALQDRSVSLPPLNRYLAGQMIKSARVFGALGQLGNCPPANLQSLENALLAVSNLVCEVPWIKELTIDPLQVDEHGVQIGPARMVIDPLQYSGKAKYAHMAIHPYPSHLVQEWPLRNGRMVTVRPIRPEDAALTLDFFNRLSPESRYFRFMEHLDDLPPSLIARFTQVDYDRELALIALLADEGKETQIGVARYSQTADGESAEFALVVDDQWQRSGLGRRLMGALIDCARERSYRLMVGDVLAANEKMLRLMGTLGFSVQAHPDGAELKRLVLQL